MKEKWNLWKSAMVSRFKGSEYEYVKIVFKYPMWVL